MQEKSLQGDRLLQCKSSLRNRAHDAQHGLESGAHHCDRHGDADSCAGSCAAVARGCRLQAATPCPGTPCPKSHAACTQTLPTQATRSPQFIMAMAQIQPFTVERKAPKLLQRRRCRLQWRPLRLMRTLMSLQLLRLTQPPACSCIFGGMASSGHCVCPAAMPITCPDRCPGGAHRSCPTKLGDESYEARTLPVVDTETLADTATDAPPAAVRVTSQSCMLSLPRQFRYHHGDCTAAPPNLHPGL